MLNLFYEEPDVDRWFPLDRYPRKIVRRLVRGKHQAGGQMRVFLNLCAGLEKIGVPFRVNDYWHVRVRHNEVACIIGKPHVLERRTWRNPIVFGAAVYSHPLDAPDLFEKYPVKRVLVPGEWMRKMCEPYWGDRVISWPVGIDTDQWLAAPSDDKVVDILVYDKVRWDRNRFETELIDPIHRALRHLGLKSATIRYGFYREAEFRKLLRQSRAMIFLCEHETQGIAYQQALACGVPILAWDRGGYWQDPAYFPHKVKFGPVSSVPYWDGRCGLKFRDMADFGVRLEEFLHDANRGTFAPRNYVMEHLTLQRCAAEYLKCIEAVRATI